MKILVLGLACGLLGTLACGGDDTTTHADAGEPDASAHDAGHDAGEPDAGPPDAGFTGLDGTSLSCGAAVAEAHGFERCSTGAVRRVSRSTCPSSVPRAGSMSAFPESDECDHDSDCSHLPLGHCARREGGQALTCVEGCEQDSDCPSGRICLCGDAVGRCIPADCATGDDCEAGFDCVLYFSGPTGCSLPQLACQTPEDQCAGNQGCIGFSVNPTFCYRGPDSAICSQVQCTQP